MKIEIEDLGAQTLTKADLSEMLYDQVGLNLREGKEMVEAFFDIISQKLVDGTDVKISDFAAFEIRDKASRPGRNPRTGEIVIVKARRVVTFRAGPNMKERIRGHEG
jgi:integration host factor subunit alpha